MISWNELLRVGAIATVPEELLLGLREEYDRVNCNAETKQAFAAFCDAAYSMNRQAQQEICADNFPAGKQTEQVRVLAVLECYSRMCQYYEENRLNVADRDELFRDAGIWMTLQGREFGYLGLSERIFNWDIDCCNGKVKSFGRLQCEVDHQVHAPMVIFRRVDGSFASRPWNGIDPQPGAVVKLGDNAVNLHIPERGKLNFDECVASLKRMNAFMLERFPELDWKGFICYSWLLDPIMNGLLPENSNIRAFQTLGCFFHYDRDQTEEVIWRAFGEKGLKNGIDTVPHRTTLQKKFAEFLKSGGKFSEGGMFIPRDAAILRD